MVRRPARPTLVIQNDEDVFDERNYKELDLGGGFKHVWNFHPETLGR